MQNERTRDKWDRDSRDLLIELRTSQENMEGKMTSLELGVKEINTGITARLLNLESNAVSKFQLVEFENRVRNLERYLWMGLGAIAVLQIVVHYILK